MSNLELNPLGRYVLSVAIQCLSLSYLVRSPSSCSVICIVMFVKPWVLKCLCIGHCVSLHVVVVVSKSESEILASLSYVLFFCILCM